MAMAKFLERRAHPRIQRCEAVALKIVFSSKDPHALGKSITGETIDVSVSGLRLALPEPLTVDSTVDLKVVLKPDYMEYFLSAKVRWCNAMDDGSYQIGVQLQELFDTPTDYKAWQAALKA